MKRRKFLPQHQLCRDRILPAQTQLFPMKLVVRQSKKTRNLKS